MLRCLTISSSAARRKERERLTMRWDERAGLPQRSRKIGCRDVAGSRPRRRPAVKKRSTGNVMEGMGAWTVGVDLGDRTSHICVLDESGMVVERGALLPDFLDS
jgi:hypothetical protein